MSDRELLIETPSAGVCVLRLNRPGAYNALSRELVDRLRKALPPLHTDGTRAVVLAAANPGFCAGADLKQRRTMSDEEKFAHNRAINALADEIAALPMPTIALVNGAALGGGCEIALACDIRYASDTARIGLTEARIGAIPGAGGTQRLPRLIGTARALELMFTGEPVEAARAATLGLVNRVVPTGDLDAVGATLAGTIANRSPRAAALLKRIVYTGIELSLADGLALEGAAIADVLASEDYREGLAAFAEKREPRFS